jgi:type II secretory pathway component PulL
LASCLNEASEAVPHDISERLRFSREQALSRAALVRRQSTVAATSVQVSGKAAVLAGPPNVWWRFASLMPLAVLVAGLVMIQQHHDQEQIAVAAEIDAALLADELPPAAYRDPGFTAFLQANDGP